MSDSNRVWNLPASVKIIDEISSCINDFDNDSVQEMLSEVGDLAGCDEWDANSITFFLIDYFASKYGWTAAETASHDFAELWVLIRRERQVSAADNTNAINNSSLFVPNKFQCSILGALDGVALSVDALAKAIKCERSRLYKPNGLHELRAFGKIQHKSGLGYYREDRPPSV